MLLSYGIPRRNRIQQGDKKEKKKKIIKNIQGRVDAL
jgi:hypothetical protein